MSGNPTCALCSLYEQECKCVDGPWEWANSEWAEGVKELAHHERYETDEAVERRQKRLASMTLLGLGVRRV